MEIKVRPKMSVWKYLSLGYLIVILIGSVLLVMPFAARDGHTSYLNALFTSASATCVTGLVVYDTSMHWNLFGQIVILCLIQLGGLGFTTFVTVLFMMVRRGNLGLYERRAMMQSLGGTRLKGVGTLIKRIVVGTFVLEFTGACLLSIRFIADFGPLRGIFYSVFHAVSAFCNAGFDLLGRWYGEFSSLSHYAHDPLVVLVISALIIVGGLGFCIWGDVFDRKFRLNKCQFYTKFILVVNSAILVLSIVLFLIFERSGQNFGNQLLEAIFNATTARTAGFSTVSPQNLSQSGFLLMVVLMFIGGCSGSTAGGVKVSTFAVIVMGMWANLRGRRDINLGRHRLDNTLVGQALAIFVSYLSLVLVSTILILAIETHNESASFAAVLYETVSAIGTVGLSCLLTPTLTIASKIILILLMYLGRVGILTLAFALRVKRSEPEVRKPLVDTLYIG